MIRETFVVCLKDHTWVRMDVDFEEVETDEDATSEELENYLKKTRLADRTDIAFVAHVGCYDVLVET